MTPSKCCVCCGLNEQAFNPLLACSSANCDIVVHRLCYGEKSNEKSNWVCNRCDGQSVIDEMSCELCPSREGIVKRTVTGGWAHLVCAQFIPGIRFESKETREPIDLQDVDRQLFGRPCYICEEKRKGKDKVRDKSRLTACICCQKVGCGKYFHVTCGQKEGLLCKVMTSQFVGYCKDHRRGHPADFRRLSSTPTHESEKRQIDSRDSRDKTRAQPTGSKARKTSSVSSSPPSNKGELNDIIEQLKIDQTSKGSLSTRLYKDEAQSLETNDKRASFSTDQTTSQSPQHPEDKSKSPPISSTNTSKAMRTLSNPEPDNEQIQAKNNGSIELNTEDKVKDSLESILQLLQESKRLREENVVLEKVKKDMKTEHEKKVNAMKREIKELKEKHEKDKVKTRDETRDEMERIEKKALQWQRNAICYRDTLSLITSQSLEALKNEPETTVDVRHEENSLYSSLPPVTRKREQCLDLNGNSAQHVLHEEGIGNGLPLNGGEKRRGETESRSKSNIKRKRSPESNPMRTECDPQTGQPMNREAQRLNYIVDEVVIFKTEFS